jgi:hypothetical protein
MSVTASFISYPLSYQALQRVQRPKLELLVGIFITIFQADNQCFV